MFTRIDRCMGSYSKVVSMNDVPKVYTEVKWSRINYRFHKLMYINPKTLRKKRFIPV